MYEVDNGRTNCEIVCQVPSNWRVCHVPMGSSQRGDTKPELQKPFKGFLGTPGSVGEGKFQIGVSVILTQTFETSELIQQSL